MTEENQNDCDFVNVFRKLKFLNQNVILGQISSLKFITLNWISVHLWRDHFRYVECNVICKENIFERMRIREKKILKKISYIWIPKNCKVALEQMINCFKRNLEKFLVQQDLSKYLWLSLNNMNIYLDNISFSQQGTINYAQSATQLIYNAPLDPEDKYKLACNNCLDENIEVLLKLFPNNFIDEYNVENDCLMMFWTCLYRIELEKFSTHIRGANIVDYILKWAIKQNNELAVHYIWENLADEEIKNYLPNYMNYSMRYPSNLNLCHYFFQQMSESQVLNLEVNVINLLLEKFYNLSKWYDLPPIAKYIPHLIIKYDTLNAVEILLFCWNKKLIKFDQYRTLWENFAHRFKLDIENNFINICQKIFSSSILHRNDIVSIKLFINISTRNNIKKFLACEIGIEYCVLLIIIEGPVHFDTFLKNVFEENKFLEFKTKIFEEKSLELCVGLTVHCKYEWINKFLIDCITRDQINEFKKNLTLVNNAVFIECILKLASNFKLDFLAALNNVLFWRFDGIVEEVEKYKGRVFDVDMDLYMNERNIFFQVLYNLIVSHNKCELVKKYMKWIYFTSNVNKRTAKEKIVRVKKILKLISGKPNSRLSMYFIAEYELLQEFMTSCFQQSEIEELEKELDYENYILKLVVVLIKNFLYQNCENLLHWHYSSDEVKIGEFKTSFMYSRGCSSLYNLFKNRHFMNVREQLFEWFNPSQESAKLFKIKFIKYIRFIKKSKSLKLEPNDEAKIKFERFCTRLNRKVKDSLTLFDRKVDSLNMLENMVKTEKRKRNNSINLNPISEGVTDETSCPSKKKMKNN